MSAQKPAQNGPKELDLTGAFDWDNSEALTRLIPNSAAPVPPTATSVAWRPPPSARRLEPSPRLAAGTPPRAPSAPSAPPAPVAQPRAASAPPPPPPAPIAKPRAASAPPPPPPPSVKAAKAEPKEPITGFLPPQQMQAMASLPAPTAPPAKKSVSLVRVASYTLVLLLAAGVGLKAMQGKRARTPRAAASAALAAKTAALAATPATPKARPVIETRVVEAPSVKDAAAAFARGDYREALAQYRVLAQQDPQQEAFKSLVSILERRLTPKTPSP
jgi:hypothetical protein